MDFVDVHLLHLTRSTCEAGIEPAALQEWQESNLRPCDSDVAQVRLLASLLNAQLMLVLILLRWAIHLNITVIPRSHDPRHILLNFKTLDMELSEHEIKLITEEWLPSTSQGTEQESEGLGTNDEEPADLEGPGAREENDDNHVTNDGNKDEL